MLTEEPMFLNCVGNIDCSSYKDCYSLLKLVSQFLERLGGPGCATSKEGALTKGWACKESSFNPMNTKDNQAI